MSLKVILLLFALAIGVFLLATLVRSPVTSNALLYQNCTQVLLCQDDTGPTCTCAEVNSSDNVYANNGGSPSGIQSSGGTPANIITQHNQTVIPNGSRITNVELQVEWARSASGGTCAISVFNGTWNDVNQTCPGTGADEFVRINISSVITNKTLAENVTVRINYTKSGAAVQLKVDLIAVNITFLPEFRFTDWNLTNSTGVVPSGSRNFTRNETLNVSVKWNVYTSIGAAFVEHNGTGSLVNYSITGPFTNNWTNHTLNFTNYTEFPRAGNITVNAVYANDSFGKENQTVGARFFILRGHADARNISFGSSPLLNGTNTSLYCNITDSNSTAVIPNYNVSFWKNDSYLGSGVTNSSGLASFVYADTTNITNLLTQTFTFKCNITSQDDVFYTASPANQITANLTAWKVLIEPV